MNEDRYIQVTDDEKLALLRQHDFKKDGWPDLNQTRWCWICGQEFTGRSVRVWTTPNKQRWLECGTPNCYGCPIEWSRYPWWDKKHPKTRSIERGKKFSPLTAGVLKEQPTHE